MSERTDSIHWTDYLSLALVVSTILVGVWYALIWFRPLTLVNPFPPGRLEAAAAVPSGGRGTGGGGPDELDPTRVFPPTWTPAPVGEVTATATWMPTSTLRPRSTPTPSATPNPAWRYYIAGMRARRYEGSQVVLHGTFGESPAYVSYLVFYNSDGLRISGMMNVPKGRGPFPVIILCHGFIEPDKFSTGMDTWREADYMARSGYVTLAPDYRSHAASDNGPSFFHIGYAEDVLNLIASLSTVQKADPRRVGLWGHSMGGAIALKAAVVSREVDGVVVFGSVSADEIVNTTYGMGNSPGASGLTYLGSPTTHRVNYKRISPINYLDRIPALSIHHGTADETCPADWSETLFKEAQSQGTVAELYLYKGAAHTFRDADWDLAMERTLQFFDDHVKNGGVRQTP